ncbi:MAG: helix-turn-helix domain-containing protein [Planctomycetes bacterium]|nr:helix-turn-helix domain-containing protein [Planctomycetota bacterium]
MADYFSFEDVLGELQLDEDELKRMVSEGELRAFRDENKMKFRKDDVDALKKGRVTEPTIILPAQGAGSAKDQDTGETLLDMDNLSSGGADETALPQLETGGGAPSAKANEETVSGDTTGITEEMIFDDSDLTVTNEGPASGTGIETQETFIEGEGGTGLTTEPLKFDEAAEGAATVQEPSVKAAKSGLRQPAVQQQVAMMPVPSVQSHPVLTTVLVLAAVFLGMMGAVLMDTVRVVTDGDKERINRPSGFAGEIAKIVVGTFGMKDVEARIDQLMKGEKAPAAKGGAKEEK